MNHYKLPSHWVFAAHLGPKTPFYKNSQHLESWLKKNATSNHTAIKSHTPFLTLCSEGYPTSLRGAQAPPVLFYRGNINLLYKRLIAAVGTRYCSTHGLEYARLLSLYLSEHQLPSISGLAQGIDCMIHEQAKGCTIGVLPCGFNKIPSSLKIKCDSIIAQGGLILSEFLPNMPPRKWRYIQRNRIIAWLAEMVILIEAPQHSGALHTVRYAQKRKRVVWVVPSSPLSVHNRGGLGLIAMGFPALCSLKQLAHLFNIPVPVEKNRIMSRRDFARHLNLHHDELDKELTRLQIEGTILPLSFGHFLWNPS